MKLPGSRIDPEDAPADAQDHRAVPLDERLISRGNVAGGPGLSGFLPDFSERRQAASDTFAATPVLSVR
ncbi:hypothetical protein [Singulisphaera sp. PoT]|uniref:hypothetical protein n=1 Tax=Singulisphaera sp. PoT TaxID=3411797 RepID=UPI003BF49E83